MGDAYAQDEDSPTTLPIPGCDGSTEHFDLEFGGYRLEIDYYSAAAANRASCRKGQQLRRTTDGSAFVFQIATTDSGSGRLAAGL